MCLGLAVLSLLGHATPGFDPWVWLVWGRELVALELDTTAAAAWKPLPVLVTGALSLAGEAAPALWLVVARAGGLLAVVATFRLAARLAGRPAGVVAAAALLVTPGVEARFARLVIQGTIEPLVVALCLGAVERHLDGREGQAFALGVAAGLARPEVWPLLGLYGLWLWGRRPALRGLVAAGLVAVPVLWLGGDWIGSGDPFTGVERARVLDSRATRLERALSRTGSTVILPVWVGALAGVLTARRGDRTLVTLAAAAVGWLAISAVLTIVFGYAMLGRFLLPAAAVLCVLAGVGAVRGVALLADRRVRVAVALGLTAVTIAVAAPRVRAGLDEVALTIQRERLDRQLDVALADAGGAGALEPCPVAIETEGPALSSWPALAWKLGRAVDAVGFRVPEAPGVAVALTGGEWADELEGTARVLGRSEAWTIFGVGCPG